MSLKMQDNEQKPYFKTIDGKLHKLCTGPAHETPEYLPASSKYFYSYKSGPRKGRFTSRCRLCTNWDKLKSPGSHHGWVDLKVAWPIINEAINRIGMMELHRRSGVSETTLANCWYWKQKHIQKAKLRLITLELISSKRKGEEPLDNTTRHQNLRRINRHAGTCIGCGIGLDDYTPACRQCIDRKYKRMKRNGGQRVQERKTH